MLRGIPFQAGGGCPVRGQGGFDGGCRVLRQRWALKQWRALSSKTSTVSCRRRAAPSAAETLSSFAAAADANGRWAAAWAAMHARRRLWAECPLHAARCVLHAARCVLHAARCVLHAARCVLHVACCTLRVARCTAHAAHAPDVLRIELSGSDSGPCTRPTASRATASCSEASAALSCQPPHRRASQAFIHRASARARKRGRGRCKRLCVHACVRGRIPRRACGLRWRARGAAAGRGGCRNTRSRSGSARQRGGSGSTSK
jgi:hypothetical protein